MKAAIDEQHATAIYNNQESIKQVAQQSRMSAATIIYIANSDHFQSSAETLGDIEDMIGIKTPKR